MVLLLSQKWVPFWNSHNLSWLFPKYHFWDGDMRPLCRKVAWQNGCFLKIYGKDKWTELWQDGEEVGSSRMRPKVWKDSARVGSRTQSALWGGDDLGTCVHWGDGGVRAWAYIWSPRAPIKTRSFNDLHNHLTTGRAGMGSLSEAITSLNDCHNLQP